VNAALQTFALLLAAGAAAAETSLLPEYSLRRWGVEDGMPEGVVTSVEQRADGYLWCRTPHHQLRFDGARFVDAEDEPAGPRPPAEPSAELPPGIPPPPSDGTVPPPITAAMKDAEGAWWIGTPQGVSRWQDGRWGSLTMRDGVFPLDARCLAADREGNVWVGTSGGLVRLRRKRVRMFHAEVAGENGSITALLADSPPRLLVGAAGGGLFAGPPEALRPARFGALKANATVSVFLRGRDGTLWLGTQGDGLWRQRPDGRVSAVPHASGERACTHGISALLEDREGQLWVGTWEGLRRLNREGALATVADFGPEIAKPPTDVVQHLLADREGRVWVAYQRVGLVCFEPGGKVRRLRKTDDFPDVSPFVMHEDADGALWVGTTGGLVRWKEGKWRLFTSENGLVDPVILQILEDRDDHLWLGTRRGLMLVRKREFEEVAAGRKTVVAARHLTAEAGMADEECTGRFGARAARTADGRLWFPTMEGIAMVDPSRLGQVTFPPTVHLEEVRAGGRAFEPGAGLLRLPRGARDVEFRYTAIALTAPARAHFRHQLEGLDPEWPHATGARTVRYPHLAPGKYLFRVMARDRDSAWSAPTAPLTVVVPAFFWETLAFRALAGLAVALAAAVAAQAYYRRQAAREVELIERRHAVERERARIARDIHDDVGAGLTEIAMLSELAQKGGPPGDGPRAHLDGIFRRARELASSLNEIVWAINPANDTLESFLSYAGEFAQDFLRRAGVACRLDLPITLPSVPLGASARHHLCLAVKEALHNVVKHAGATEVHLSARLEGRRLTLSIRDNGRGFDTDAARGAGDGLANLRARLAEIGGSFHQESRPQHGSCATMSVELPTAPSPLREPH
jgi:signal transduction histidine kinase/ligand-binding sensor domain-containing protein